MRISLPVCTLLCVLLAGGGFVLGRWCDAADDAPAPGERAGQEARQAAASSALRGVTDEDEQHGGARAESQALSGARKRIVQLEATLATSRARVGELQQELAGFRNEQAVTTAAVMGKIESFRKNALGSLLDPGAKASIVSDLKALGKEGLAILRGLMRSDNKEDRMLAASLLDGMADPEMIPDLKRLAMEDTDEGVASLASRSLAFMRLPQAAEPLHEIATESKHRSARINALFGLCSLGDATGVELTLELMNDPEQPERLKQALGSGILMLDTPGVLPIVKAISAEVRKHDEAMKAVIAYYSRIGTLAGRVELQNLLNDPELSPAVREVALKALN